MGDGIRVRLGDVVDLLTGFPFKSYSYTDNSNAPKLLRGDNIAQGVLRWDGVKRWPLDKIMDIESYWLKEGDVVLAMDRPWIDAGLKYSSVRQKDLPALLVQRVSRLRAINDLDSKYLYYVIGSQEFTDYVLAIQTGTAVPHISASQIKNFQFLLPPIKTQRLIASLLSALDDKIELNRETNKTLEDLARSFFKDWFVDFGPTRAKAEGRAPYLASEIWDLFPDALDDEDKPVGWKIGCLGDCFHLTMGQSPPGSTYNDEGEGLPFFQGRTDFGFRYPENRKFCNAPARIAHQDDTLVSVRAPVGDINIAWEKSCVGRGVAALRHRSGSVSFTYYSAWAIQQELKQYEHTGTVFGAINKTQFETLQVIEPSPEFVCLFDEYVGPIDQRIRANVSESRTLAQTRDLLLPKLMSGEIRLREAEKLVEAVA